MIVVVDIVGAVVVGVVVVGGVVFLVVVGVLVGVGFVCGFIARLRHLPYRSHIGWRGVGRSWFRAGEGACLRLDPYRRFKPFRFGLTDNLIKKNVKFNSFVMTG